MTKRTNILRSLLLLLTVVAGTSIPVTLHAQTIKGDVYGGGEVATIGGNTTVTIHTGRFGADIFGGGKGELNDDKSVRLSADIGGSTTVTINGGEFSVTANSEEATKERMPFLQRHNIYGGGNIACVVGNSAYLNMAKGMLTNGSDGSDDFLKTGKGMDQVYMKEGKMFFSIFGGGYGKNTRVTEHTYVDFNVVFSGCKDISQTGLTDDMIENQTLLDVVGGGFNGSVGGNTFVHVGGDAMCRNVYGGGLYATIGGTTTVDVTGGNIDNVYGGGVMGDIRGTEGEGENAYSSRVNIGLHENESHQDADGNTITYIKANNKITILGSVYGGNDVSGHVTNAVVTHLGGTIQQNIYGAGNGNYRGYYTPNTCDFNDGENDNYYMVTHADSKPENSGRTYKGRPQTDNVKIVFDGADTDDKAVVLGQVFGGGNSCTIGQWVSDLSTKYEGDPHKWRDDPAYFLGGGNLNIHFKKHARIGRSRSEIEALDDDELKSECMNEDGVNVTGLYMGCCGKDLVTQSLNPTDYTYHHYYDAVTKQYWQGFAVYDDAGNPLTRTEGMKAYDAYLNNILVRSDNVSLTYDADATDIWLANFVGGGFRGSMQAKTSAGKFDYTLPSCVTVADAVIGGSFNAHVMYRIYDTETGGHEYKTDSEGNYLYLTDKTGLKGPDDVTAPEEPDYLRELFDDDGNTIGLVRFNYEGGILAENGGNRCKTIAGTGEFSEAAADHLKNHINEESAKALLRLTLANKLEPTVSDGIVSGGNVYGGCFQSGVVNGDSWVNYVCTVTDANGLNAQNEFSIANQTAVNTMREKADDYNTNFGMMLFGAGYGRDTKMNGDCFTAIAGGDGRLYNVFGGSFKGNCDSRTFVLCDAGSTGIIAGRLYGGSSMGDIGGSSYAYVNSGNISYVYGGNDVCGNIKDHTYVMVHGGTIFGDIYGAGNGNYLYQVDPAVKDIVATWNTELNKYIYRVPVPSTYTETLTAANKLTIINNTRPSVTKAIIDLRGNESSYLYINGSAYVGGNSSTVTSTTDPVDLKVGKYVVLNNLFLGSNGENLKAFDYISNLEKLNDMKLNTNALLDQYMNGAVAVGNLSPTWATAFSQASNYTETYIGNLCLGGNAGSMLADKKLTLIIPETITMFGNFIAGSKDAVFKYRDAEHRGGMTQPIAAIPDQPYDPVKLELHIRNQWKAKKLSFLPAYASTHYLVDNLTSDGQAYAEGCNIYGGCYQSGTMIGDIKMYIESDMLEYKNKLAEFETSESATKLKNSNARNITVANIYGAGYGPESRNYGNVDIILKDIPGSSSHPSINNIYGGGRNGVLCGHANVRINDGLVYGDVVGGCFAANLYGSTNITVGYPKYYICKQSGKYTLQRGDTWNTALLDKDGKKVLKNEVYYLKGDRVPQNIYDQIVGFGALGSESTVSTLTSEQKAAQFTFVDEATLTGEQSLFPTGGWTNVDINILGGVYGGGYSLNNSTAATAGSYTVCKMTPGEDGFNHDNDQSLGLTTGQTTAGYGGNSSIIVADNTTLTANHIKISQSGVGGVFGDGHLVFCEAFRAADITGYGYGAGTVSNPLLLNTFQRFDLLNINDCCLKVDGAQDFATDQTDATIYSMARINELRMNSTIAADAALPATTATKARNYVEFNRNVHLLGALITNDAFASTRHDESGSVQSDTYSGYKAGVITANYPTGEDSEKIANFKKRNLGTARNMIGLNSGNALRIQNQNYVDGNGQLYYGPVVGVCEVNLLTITEGEGGGYVYADNIHSDAGNFLNTSGNFVFPGKEYGESKQYVVDDCFPTGFAGAATADAHYWYVEGDKYFYNTTLTGYTFTKESKADAQTFYLKTNDPNVMLSGVKEGVKLKVASVTWEYDKAADYPAGYQPDLNEKYDDGRTPTKLDDTAAPYEFLIQVGDKTDGAILTEAWTNAMACTDMTAQTARRYNNNTTPVFDIHLTDNVNNAGQEYYDNHLKQPEKVKVVLEASDDDDNVIGTYTVNMNVTYVLGPTYTGHVNIKNCALPGERIAFASDGITVMTSDQMPITATGWKLCPPGDTPGTWDVDRAIDIPSSQYDSDLSGGSTTGWVHAQHTYDGWNIAYTFTANKISFPVWPDQTAEQDYEKRLVVHNYYRMADVQDDGDLYHLHPGTNARVYINNEKDLRALFDYLNTKADGTEKTAADGHKYTIPENMAGMHVVLQNDIKLTQALPELSREFAGTFHGDGYSIDLNDKGASLFGGNIAASAKVYNLGVIDGTITTVADVTENCFTAPVSVASASDIRYGAMAYALSHRYSKDDAGYINGIRFAGTDWQYARQNTQDSRMLRTSATPNYGSTVTAHNMEHTAAEITGHDCLFFGQTLNPTGIANTPYPQHLSDARDADGNWTEVNRVYETEGYYRSKTDGKFYYNTAAWALQPTLTAVRFDNTKAVGEQRVPTSFGSLSASETDEADYTRHVTRNLLVYEADDAAKAAGSAHFFHVTGSKGDKEPSATASVYTCADLALVDKEDFNAPYAFTATKASYVRNPGDETAYVETPGTAWESICLPFSPATTTLSEGILLYPYDAEGEWTKNGDRTLTKDVTFFYGSDESYETGNHIRHEYWLRELQSVGETDGRQTAIFVRPGYGIDDAGHRGFKAYAPYIVSFPGSRFYEFDMTGQQVAFSAENTVVAVTDDAATLATTVNGVTYHGAFVNDAGSEDKYAIALKSDDDSADGGKFEKDVAVYPFRGYMTGSVSGAKAMSRSAIYIFGQLEQDNADHGDIRHDEAVPAQVMKAYVINRNIIIESTYEADVLIHTSAGQLARAVRVLEGENLYTGFAPGVYLINGKKLVVR